MLHSGSRHIGNVLAQRHIETAKELAKLAGAKLPDPDLAHFVQGTPEFAAYWHDLQWAQGYALYNRVVMLARFQRIVERHLAGGKPDEGVADGELSSQLRRTGNPLRRVRVCDS